VASDDDDDDAAMTYNDIGVLENHHACASLKLLKFSQCDFMSEMSRAERTTFRETVIAMVMATGIEASNMKDRDD